MSIVIVITVLCLAGWMIFATFNHLQCKHSNPKWGALFALSVVVGVGVGVWVGIFMEYQPNATIRIQGFPLPLVTFVLEQDHWKDFVPAQAVQYGAMVANVLAAIAVALIPLAVASRLTEKMR